MGNYNLNAISSNLNNYKVPFKSDENGSVSNPLSSSKGMYNQQELASKECAYATKATAMAQILTGSNFKYETTPEEYIAQLIKQGKIPNKDFDVKEEPNDGNGCKFTGIVEVNSNGQKVKETSFCRDDKYSGSWNVQHFFNPHYKTTYKSIEYRKNGAVIMYNYYIGTETISDSHEYRPDGSLARYLDFKKREGINISKDGEITTFKLEG